MNLVTLEEEAMFGEKPEFRFPNSDAPICWIAGGAVRQWFSGKEYKSDVDVFGTSEAALKEFVEANMIPEKAKVFSSEKSTTYKNNGYVIQTINFFANDVEALFNSFDFTLCQFAWDGQRITTTAEAILSVLRKRLKTHNIQPGYEFDTLRRAFKYQRKGYKPCTGTLQEIAKAIRGMDDEAWEGEHPRLSERWD